MQGYIILSSSMSFLLRQRKSLHFIDLSHCEVNSPTEGLLGIIIPDVSHLSHHYVDTHSVIDILCLFLVSVIFNGDHRTVTKMRQNLATLGFGDITGF